MRIAPGLPGGDGGGDDPAHFQSGSFVSFVPVFVFFVLKRGFEFTGVPRSGTYRSH